MKNLNDYPLSELKLVYQILHSQLQDNLELMDSILLHDLQKELQTIATDQGIDISLHSDWSTWLSNLAKV